MYINKACFKVLNGVTSRKRDHDSFLDEYFFVLSTKNKSQKDGRKSFAVDGSADLSELNFLSAPISMLFKWNWWKCVFSQKDFIIDIFIQILAVDVIVWMYYNWRCMNNDLKLESSYKLLYCLYMLLELLPLWVSLLLQSGCHGESWFPPNIRGRLVLSTHDFGWWILFFISVVRMYPWRESNSVVDHLITPKL